ncbi:integral membrane [Emericellopsis cladophorae]|uniref:Integral membrane n=1 Tax=Emericellopsis cladophorae TaxID=2686198 RepID=A0A9P9XX12_9HYPO|nr:integral membrane [Emericellopsis cladophorae]KAI6779409.1 integral membrane [Emericellopsis cladophorae]
MALHAVDFPVKPIVKIHMIINCVLVVITVFVVVLRVLARLSTSAQLGWDDYLIILSTPLGLGMLAIQGLYLPMGVGYPLVETMPNLKVILQLMISYALTYTVAISAIKISVLLFYLRVFVGKRFRRVTLVVMGFVCLYTAANVLLLALMCRPFAGNYDLTIPATCADRPKVFIAIGAYNIISDVVILLLPIPMIWRLKTGREVKAGLTAVFLIGLVVSGVAVGRIFTLTSLQIANITETMVWVDFLSTTEVNLAILCVSLPMLGPLIGRLRKRRGASKLSATPDKNCDFASSKVSDNKMRRKQGGGGGSGGPGLRRMGDDTIMMDTIYDPDESHHDEAKAVADSGRHAGGKPAVSSEAESYDGSEASLRRGNNGMKTNIVVQTQ